uniref:Uncharacterized protein n=1 Tax=Eutreptiella gymnastica TaxID=73025 RepID=A0A6U8H3D3_9EUGL|mmetsp:Transcript_53235/g.95069  ORF Transcript_53235/g.95069 Transcript_53235/m.95069 type:complete len:142 (+) Transcript_53235:489-914(+)
MRNVPNISTQRFFNDFWGLEKGLSPARPCAQLVVWPEQSPPSCAVDKRTKDKGQRTKQKGCLAGCPGPCAVKKRTKDIGWHGTKKNREHPACGHHRLVTKAAMGICLAGCGFGFDFGFGKWALSSWLAIFATWKGVSTRVI